MLFRDAARCADLNEQSQSVRGRSEFAGCPVRHATVPKVQCPPRPVARQLGEIGYPRGSARHPVVRPQEGLVAFGSWPSAARAKASSSLMTGIAIVLVYPCSAPTSTAYQAHRGRKHRPATPRELRRCGTAPTLTRGTWLSRDSIGNERHCGLAGRRRRATCAGSGTSTNASCSSRQSARSSVTPGGALASRPKSAATAGNATGRLHSGDALLCARPHCPCRRCRGNMLRARGVMPRGPLEPTCAMLNATGEFGHAGVSGGYGHAHRVRTRGQQPRWGGV